MKMWVFNCKEISRLVSESMDRNLTFSQRVGVRFHLLMCRYCARFACQLTQIRKLIRSQQEGGVPHNVMTDKAKDELNEFLKKHNQSQ